MSEQEQDQNDKPHEATQRKLDQARRKGELPRAADLTATAALAGLLSLSLLPGGWMPIRLGEVGHSLIERADPMSQAFFAGGTATAGSIVLGVAVAVLPALLLPVVAVIGVLMALRGIVFAPSKLKPRASRISVISNAKQKFGLSGLFEFAKNTAKLTLYGTVLWLFLSSRIERIIATIGQSPGQAAAELMRLLVEFLTIVVVIMALVGAVDFLWQRFDHLRRQRMSHKELRDEQKQAEGDPHMKQERQSRGRAIATNRMLDAVPDADVVIVNPTHYAVALQWDRSRPEAPRCVAKGVDEIARRIRERAEEADVPIHHDAPTARALHAATELGEEIAPEHYAPVAAAIRFAEAMRQKARRSWRAGGAAGGNTGGNSGGNTGGDRP